MGSGGEPLHILRRTAERVYMYYIHASDARGRTEATSEVDWWDRTRAEYITITITITVIRGFCLHMAPLTVNVNSAVSGPWSPSPSNHHESGACGGA